jgi:hypothetical protein
MREHAFWALVFVFAPAASAQTVPTGWKPIRDAKASCQIAVPPDWAQYSERGGSAVLRDPSSGLAVVTSQPGQEFKPLTASMLKSLGVPKEKVFENSTTRLFFEDRTSENSDDQSGFSASVPGNGGTCSCRVVFLPSVGADTARKIVMTLGPASDSPTKSHPRNGEASLLNGIDRNCARSNFRSRSHLHLPPFGDPIGPR